MAGKTYKGQYTPQNPQKYKGKVGNITFRSSWERRVMFWLDTQESVLQWSSEETIIPYLSDLDGKIHRYYVDFWALVRKHDGTTHQVLLEVKPHKETVVPSKRGKKPERYAAEVKTYVVNRSKWRAAMEYCAKRGMSFLLVDEHTLGLKKRKTNGG